MGEAKRKQQTHAAMLAASPGCIYCAGANGATTIEHMPPIQIFFGRHRPRGLEFPACVGCNKQTGHSDLVAAMLARSLTEPEGAASRVPEFEKVLSAVANNVPGLLEEMKVFRAAEKLARKRHGLADDMHPLRVDGPILSRHILTFAAKLGFALHFETTGAVIPPGGGVMVMWFTNLQAMRGDIPQGLLDLLPAPKSLHQGRMNVGSQFQYSTAVGEHGHMLYYATFNNSFAVSGVTAIDRSIWLAEYAEKFSIFQPGDFAGNLPLALMRPQPT
ncbi:MAG: hypothetical protein H0V72_19085 [Bradyrhizobium sp.]|nr:hypothetical protein [Bradyrhizobium sp.]